MTPVYPDKPMTEGGGVSTEMTKTIWTCSECGWSGYIRTGHQWTFRVLPDGEIQGPFTHFPDLIDAMREAERGPVEVTTTAQCPQCSSRDMKKEDVPDDD
jgi:hypothetical protein